MVVMIKMYGNVPRDISTSKHSRKIQWGTGNIIVHGVIRKVHHCIIGSGGWLLNWGDGRLLLYWEDGRLLLSWNDGMLLLMTAMDRWCSFAGNTGGDTDMIGGQYVCALLHLDKDVLGIEIDSDFFH